MHHIVGISFVLIFSSHLFARESCSFSCQSIPDPSEVLTAYSDPSIDALSPQSIRVHIWNIYKGRKPTWITEYPRLIPDSDILLIQESNMDNGIQQKLLAPLGFSTFSAGSFFRKDEAVTGLVSTSRVEALSARWVRSRVKEPFVKTYKLVLLTEYPLKNSNETLLVANIHGLNRRTAKDLENQVRDALQLAAHHTGPFLFTGDFNSRNKKRQKYIDKAMSDYGLEKVVWQNEYRTKPIDHAYVRKLRVNQALIKTEFVGSDHPLLYLDFATK